MKKMLLLPLLLLTLTACKIDLTIIGLGEVKTDSETIDCASGRGKNVPEGLFFNQFEKL